MTKAKKISLLISIVLIIVGAIVFATMGFNYDLSYGNATRIVVPMKDSFEIEDYKSIAKEIYKDTKVELVSVFKDGVSIKVKDTSDEQLDNLVSKINEKYGYEYTKEDLKITQISKVEFFDIVKKVIIPVLTTILVVLVYMIIRYRKLGLINIILNLFIPAVLLELLVLAVYLICRIPVTNVLLPIILTVYVASILYSTKQCENQKN